MAINACEISLVDCLPVKQRVLPTFLIAGRKNRRNLFTGFLHNIPTSGAAGSGWRSWGRAETSRAIRQLGNRSLKGICPNTANSPAPTELQRSAEDHGCGSRMLERGRRAREGNFSSGASALSLFACEFLQRRGQHPQIFVKQRIYIYVT